MPSQLMADEAYRMQRLRAQKRAAGTRSQPNDGGSKMADTATKKQAQDGKLTPRKAAAKNGDGPKRTAAEKYVYDALRKAGYKFADLTDEQRDRALSAGEAHPGLRGKSLVAWIVDGQDLGAQLKDAANNRAVVEAAESERRRSDAAKASGSRPPKSEPRYPQDIRDAVKRANEIRGKSHGAGPKQHVRVREVVAGEVKPLTVAGIVKASGAKDLAHLFALAAEAPREDLKALRPLAEKMGDDPWCKGRHLAAALAAWTDEIAAAQKGGGAK